MNIGIIGFGGMGNFHAEQIDSLAAEGFKVVGIYDINPDRRDFAEGAGRKAYSTREELLCDDEIETVVVATPNNFHKEIAVDALNHGKNVICEKPVAMNAAEWEEMMAAASSNGKLLAAHQNRRWDNDFRTVKNAIDNGTLGTPFFIESRVQGANGIPGDWRCEAVAGGGMLLDWGVHLIDQIMWMIKSPVVEVSAQLLKVKFSVDDNIKVMLRFENEVCALVQVDTYNFTPGARWSVAGTGGSMMINDFGCGGRIVKSTLIEENYEPGIVHTAAGPTKTMAPRPKESIEELPLEVAQCDPRDYYRNFAAAMRGEEELIVKPEESLEVMRVIDAAFNCSNSL